MTNHQIYRADCSCPETGGSVDERLIAIGPNEDVTRAYVLTHLQAKYGLRGPYSMGNVRLKKIGELDVSELEKLLPQQVGMLPILDASSKHLKWAGAFLPDDSGR